MAQGMYDFYISTTLFNFRWILLLILWCVFVDTPRKIPLLHMISWVLNLFALFFIIASHQHYSIDVFVAFYISSRLFLYYHSLANNRVLRQPDCKRTRIWFPLFSYFESSVNCIVPNEYEWPHSAILRYIQRRWSLCHNLDIQYSKLTIWLYADLSYVKVDFYN